MIKWAVVLSPSATFGQGILHNLITFEKYSNEFHHLNGINALDLPFMCIGFLYEDSNKGVDYKVVFSCLKSLTFSFFFLISYSFYFRLVSLNIKTDRAAGLCDFLV